MSGTAATTASDDFGELWEVVAVAADPTGVIVREGHDLTSEKVEERLTLGAKVKQLDVQGERLHFHLIAGRGPREGWVTKKVRDKSLLRRTTWRPSSYVAEDHYVRCEPHQASGALLNPQPEKMNEIFVAPLEYTVQPKQVSIHKAPSTKAPVLGKLLRDNKVLGFQQGNWLKLREAPGGWVQLSGEDAASSPPLCPSKVRFEVLRAVAEGAALRWDKVPARTVRYAIEWAPAEDLSNLTTALEGETKCMVRIHGLPPESELKVRLRVRIFTDDEAYGGKLFAMFVTDWEDMETERAVDELEESNNCIDNFSNFRGKCMDCACDGFTMAGIGERHQHVDFADLLCRRCCCPCVLHTVIGELVVGWNRGTKPPTEKPQAKKSFQPPPRPQQAALPCSGGEAASWKESDFKRWRPEDAGEGDRVKFVLDCVAQAVTLYETLGVAPSAEEKDIRSAYRHISLHIHPDKVQNRGEKELVEQAEAAFKIVCSAYDVLNDVGQRAAYDRSIRVAKPTAVSKGGSRSDLTGISFLKKFLGKFKSTGWDLKQKPKGDWEDQGGGVYARSVGVKATVRHAVSGEELVLVRLDKGVLLSRVKSHIVRETKRGPESRIELCSEDGTELQDSYRMNQSETFVLVGISLGSPVDIEVCLSHANTGARLKLHVLDTASIEEVRWKAADTLGCPSRDIRLGCRAKNRERFQDFEDKEFLNGRTQLLLLGAEIQMILEVEEATELQTELRDAYGADWFQKRLDSMLDEMPLPDCLGNRTFQEQFAELVRQAQQVILVKHGFDGPKGVFNMYAAFRDVGAHPDVVRLTWEIDQKLRVTTSGRMWSAVPVVLQACEVVHVTLESSALVRVALESCFSWSEQPPLCLAVPAQSCVRLVHEAAARRLEAQLEELQLVHGEELDPHDLTEPIGSRRTFKVLGKDLPQEEESLQPDPWWDGYGQVVEDGDCIWRPRYAQLQLPLHSTVATLREALACRAGLEAGIARLAWGEDFVAAEDYEPLGERARFWVFGASLPEVEEPQRPSARDRSAAAASRSIKVSVVSHGTLRDVREAAAKKLGVEVQGVHLLHPDGSRECDESEPVGNHRKLLISGVDLP